MVTSQPRGPALRVLANYENPTRPEHIDTQTRCLLPGSPRLYYFPTFRFLQSPGSVVILWDEYHAFRVIPIDGRPHVGANVKLWMGDGRGRWEGTTLVVDASQTGRTGVVPLLALGRPELAELRLRQGRPGPAAPIIATDRGEFWVETRFRSFRRHRTLPETTKAHVSASL